MEPNDQSIWISHSANSAMFKGKLKLSDEIKRVIPDWLINFVDEDEEDRSKSHDVENFNLKQLVSGISYRYENEKEEEIGSMVASTSVAVKVNSRGICGSGVNDVEEKRSELEILLSQRIINVERLQIIASTGLPNDGGLRSTSWKILLGYLPETQDLWEGELAKNRSKYAILKDELLLNPSEFTRRKEECSVLSMNGKKSDSDGLLRRHEISQGDHPLSEAEASIWHQYFQDAEMVEQIDRDLQRTHPEMMFFSGDSSFSHKTQKTMKNILLLFAKLNPAIRYVQGMNEVLAPLYYVFSTDPDDKNSSNAEADGFFCFIRLLSDSVYHFCEKLDNSSVGIHSTLSRLEELLKANDMELWLHLAISNQVNSQFYAFRWITLLLTQDFNFGSILRIWDFLLSSPSGVQEMLLRVCCAMIVSVRSRLLHGDFTANLYLLQHYPEVDIGDLLQVAQALQPITSS